MGKRQKTQSGESLKEKLSRTLDIPPDLFAGGSLIEIRGQNALSVRGGGKILRYTDSEIRISLKACELSVLGQRLVCTSYCKGAVGIDGQIESVSFCPCEKKGSRGGRG